MGAPQTTTSFSCDLTIIRARNIELKHAKKLFVRCYFSAGSNNEKVQINSQEISSKSDLYWNELFSLDCSSTEDSINLLKQGNILMELRCRGRFGSSKIMGTAEIPWRTVYESPEMEIETWVSIISKNGGVHEDVKPPAVKIAVKVNNGGRRIKNRKDRWDECGCMDGRCNNNCVDYVDYDMFALGFALQAL